MICLACRLQVDEKWPHCHNCGNKLEDKCPVCGKLHRTPMVFCAKTGKNLHDYEDERHREHRRELERRPIFWEFIKETVDLETIGMVLGLLAGLFLILWLLTFYLTMVMTGTKNYWLPPTLSIIISFITTVGVIWRCFYSSWQDYKRQRR